MRKDLWYIKQSAVMSRQHNLTATQLPVRLCHLSSEQGTLWFYIIWAPYLRLGYKSCEKGPVNLYFSIPYVGMQAKVMLELWDSNMELGNILVTKVFE
jgi:hypothetical protein